MVAVAEVRPPGVSRPLVHEMASGGVTILAITLLVHTGGVHVRNACPAVRVWQLLSCSWMAGEAHATTVSHADAEACGCS